MPRIARQDLVAAAAIVAFGVWSLGPGLGHPTIFDWDESFHQAVTRATYESPPVPKLYVDPLYPTNPAAWFYANVWLHKPPGTPWFGAAMMHVVGVTPLALRLGSLLGELLAALSLYWLVKARGRFWAFAAALGFLALPAGWILAQGYFFGDVTDCTLVGWVTFAVLLLCVGVERESVAWLAAAGAAVGAGYLCKSMLALVPLGTAVVLFTLRSARVCDGPKWKGLLAMIGAFAVVALPWNFYASARWPELARVTMRQALEFITGPPGSDAAMWNRPWDAILNEVNAFEVRPLPVAGVLLAGVWLWRMAIRTRDHKIFAVAIWLTATELIHSLVAVKSPAHVWNAIPAVFAGLALLGGELWSARVGLATPAAAAALLATPWLTQMLPLLARWRAALPGFFFQTKTLVGLFEGVLAMSVAVAIALVVGPSIPARWRTVIRALGFGSGAWLAWVMLVSASSMRVEQATARLKDTGYSTYTKEVGLALGALPRNSVLWLPVDRNPPGQFEQLNLMFWSGRMAELRQVDLHAARAKGYRSYVVAPVALPLQPVAGVPANAWLRAYDAETPAGPAPLPPGVTPVSVDAGSLEVVGVASGPAGDGRDRWAIYARAKGGPPSDLRAVFHLREGPPVALSIAPEATLLDRSKLVGMEWFVLPALGPARAEVKELELGPSGARVAISSAP